MKRISYYYIVVLIGASSVLFSCGNHHGGGFSVPPPAQAVPGAPMAVSAVAGNEAISLGWSAVASATKYNIYRSNTAGTETKIASSNTTSYSDTGLVNGSSYYYVITAANSRGEGVASNEVFATPNLPSGSITISGTVLYQDKEYGANGFTGKMPYKAVRYASVELVDDVSSNVLGTTQTDSTGAYNIVTASTTSVVYLRVKTEATLSGITPQVTVKSLSGSIYSAVGNNFIPSGSAGVNITVPATSIGGAFNILDVFTNGIQFVNSLSGTYPAVPLYGFWQKSNPEGTYYCSSNCPSGEEGIYILNYSGDTDEYDDDVLYHEFGHFIAAHVSQDDSPGGVHYLTDNDLDMRLAWSEGWGDSMPGSIKMWLSSTAPDLLSSATNVPLTEYVDTYGDSAQIAIDMDNPDGAYGYYNTFIYSCSEVAIAKIILDLNRNFGMPDVWSVLTNFQTNHPNPVNLELFWDQWHSLGEPIAALAGAATIDSIFTNRQVFYSLDNFEPDDPISSATTYTVNMTGLQQHTLYGDGDVDYISFDTRANQHYTVTTLNLKNGADTYITVINPDKTTITSANDNASGIDYVASQNNIYPLNDATTLSSLASFIATTTGTYYVSVRSSPWRPVSAGRYGSYTLSITNP